jgi:dipeptidyl aminopeptidase/acylaminoacyl peptidase
MFACLAGLTLTLSAHAQVVTTTANDGQLVMEDIPAIPQSVVADLNRYQNVRSAAFQEWTADGKGIYVSTRFGDVDQLHRVDFPGGARHQLTFFDEPVSGLSRQPQGSRLIFAMDAGGSEFDQLFSLDPDRGSDAAMLTDGQSRNGAVVWDREGQRIAYQSTRRNGSSNDVWMMQVDNPETAEVVLESPDGTYWSASDFSPDNSKLLIINYVGNADSRIHLLDLASGSLRRLAGDPDNPSSNFPFAFDHEGKGFWYITDRNGDFQQLAWQALEQGAEPVIVTADIPWNVEGGDMSDDRLRGAFTVNQGGLSKLYLLDGRTREFKAVDGLPTGVVGGVTFSPDASQLGLTLNTASTPSDSFVLALADNPLQHGALTRWTFSEVGGLDTDSFIEPTLVEFPTFDSGSGGPDHISSWLYQPEGAGPYPVVISIHGGPESQSRPSFSSTYQQWLQKLGVAVLVPNVRGSAGYG